MKVKSRGKASGDGRPVKEDPCTKVCNKPTLKRANCPAMMLAFTITTE